MKQYDVEKYKNLVVEYCNNVSVWRKRTYISLLIIVLLAAFAFVVRVSTGNYMVSAVLAICMIPVTFFVFFSFYKFRFWQDRLKMNALFLDAITIFINAEEEKDD